MRRYLLCSGVGMLLAGACGCHRVVVRPRWEVVVHATVVQKCDPQTNVTGGLYLKRPLMTGQTQGGVLVVPKVVTKEGK